MKHCVILGKVGCGKTLFLLNFSEYLGISAIEMTQQEPDGGQKTLQMAVNEARKTMVSPNRHTTRTSYTMTLSIPKGKGKKQFYLTDTPGLIESIHPDREIRLGIVQAIKQLKTADVVLHLMDASRASLKDDDAAITDVDHQIARYSTGRRSYLILANKMDLPGASAGFSYIKRTFPGKMIIPISALKRWGFKEVKIIVARLV